MVNVCQQLVRSVRPEILKAIDDTRRTQIEHGFTVCEPNVIGEPKRLNAGAYCTGTGCQVTLRYCEGQTTVGSFHTHPFRDNPQNQLYASRTQPRFSTNDLLSAVKTHERFTCLVSLHFPDRLHCMRIPKEAGEGTKFYEKIMRHSEDTPRIITYKIGDVTTGVEPPPVETYPEIKRQYLERFKLYICEAKL